MAPATSPLVQQLRQGSHYPLLRRAIQLLFIIYIASIVLGLVMLVTHQPRGMGTPTWWLSFATGTGLHVVGAVLAREFLHMVVDWFDVAQQRRS